MNILYQLSIMFLTDCPIFFRNFLMVTNMCRKVPKIVFSRNLFVFSPTPSSTQICFIFTPKKAGQKFQFSHETPRIIIFGMSKQRSSWSAFGQSTGNDVSGHYKHHYHYFGTSVRRSSGQHSGSRHSTAGNDIVANIVKTPTPT